MGLDQWLFRKENEDVLDSEGKLIECHDTVMIYWRKCNQVHNWFDKLVGGIENCGDYPITIKDLENLKKTCETVLENPDSAEELLPVMTGPFFGGYEYDEYYIDDLEYTVEKINEFLEEDHTDEEFYYHAWW